MIGQELDPSWGRFALASVVVVGLLSLLAFALKYMAQRGVLLSTGSKKRLRFVEALPLDSKRRLVIARCDDKEYLLLLGAHSDLQLTCVPVPPTDNTKDTENDA